MRVHNQPQWSKDAPEARFVRQRGCAKPQTYELYREWVESRPPQGVANLAICLLHQASYLLDRQLRRLDADFLEQGGLRERLTRARLTHRRPTHDS